MRKRKLCRQTNDTRIFYYVLDKDNVAVAYGILKRGQQVETEQPVLKQSTSRTLFNDIFNRFTIVKGEIKGVLK